MKINLSITIILGLMLLFVPAKAQIELHAFGGYVPKSKTMYSYNGYRFQIEGGGNYGIGLAYYTPFGSIGELSYMRYSSTISQTGGTVEVLKEQPINVEYYQLSMLNPFMESEKLLPYGLFSLGAARFKPVDLDENFWRFAVGLGLGINYYFTETVGIKLQTRLLMPLYFAGAGMGCSIGTGGSGCGSGAWFGGEIVQGDFTGGVVFRFND